MVDRHESTKRYLADLKEVIRENQAEVAQNGETAGGLPDTKVARRE